VDTPCVHTGHTLFTQAACAARQRQRVGSVFSRSVLRPTSRARPTLWELLGTAPVTAHCGGTPPPKKNLGSTIEPEKNASSTSLSNRTLAEKKQRTQDPESKNRTQDGPRTGTQAQQSGEYRTTDHPCFPGKHRYLRWSLPAKVAASHLEEELNQTEPQLLRRVMVSHMSFQHWYLTGDHLDKSTANLQDNSTKSILSRRHPHYCRIGIPLSSACTGTDRCVVSGLLLTALFRDCGLQPNWQTANSAKASH